MAEVGAGTVALRIARSRIVSALEEQIAAAEGQLAGAERRVGLAEERLRGAVVEQVTAEMYGGGGGPGRRAFGFVCDAPHHEPGKVAVGVVLPEADLAEIRDAARERERVTDRLQGLRRTLAVYEAASDDELLLDVQVASELLGGRR